jgi:hypothetical protein
MRSGLTILLAGLALLAAPAAVLAQKGGPGPEQARAKLEKLLPDVIEKAQAWLIAQQRRDGSFVNDQFGNAFIPFSLLESGLPAKHPAMQRAIEYLLKARGNETQMLAVRLELLVRFRAQLPATTRGPLDDRIASDLKDLLAAQAPDGVFKWSPTSGNWQGQAGEFTFEAFKALRFCADQGLRVPDTVLKKTVAMYVADQNSNGGWSNSSKGKDAEGSDGVLSIRALANLAAFGLDQSCREGAAKSDFAIADAAREAVKYLRDNNYRWLATGKEPPDPWALRQAYYLGSFVHVLPGEMLGGTRLVQDFCLPLATRQEDGGNWRGPLETAFALYLLAQEAQPPLICDLVDADAPSIGNRALLAAVEHLSLAGPLAVRYDRARIGPDFKLWEKTPLVFLDATDKFKLADDEKKNLRDYVAAGGTILVQIHCGKKEVLDAVTRELQPLWPAIVLQPLRPNHPVWTCDSSISSGIRSPILGLDDGVRTFAFLFQKNLIGDLAAGAVAGGNPTAFQMFRNVAAYALEGDWNFTKPLNTAGPAIPATLQPGKARTIAVALVVPAARADAPSEAPPLPYNGWPLAAEPITKAAPKFKLLGPKPLAATNENLSICDLAYLSVTSSAALGDDELAALKNYVAGGGFLLLEARLGDEALDKSARKISDALGLQIESAKGSPLLTGQFGGGANGYDVSKTSPRKGGKLLAPAETDLRLLTLAGKTVGVYSPLDLNVSASGIRCWGLRGYSPAEARQILANIILFRTAR